MWKVSFQFRQMDVVGASLAVWARVVGKKVTDQSYDLETLELGIVNTEGCESTPGTAIVALPLRGGRVPYLLEARILFRAVM